MADLPVIVVFSKAPVRLLTPPGFIWETRDLDCRWYPRDARLDEIIARERPHVIVSFGHRADYSRLRAASPDTQRKWLHFEGEATPAQIQAAGTQAFERFIHNALTPVTPEEASPLVSVFTPTFRTGEKRLQRAFDSLRAQEYANWEWVVVDDPGDEGETLRVLENLAARDSRLKVFPSSRRSGRIGELKRRACSLAEGEILAELDHDDELTPNALGDVVRAFVQFPEAGLVYTDWADVHEETGEAVMFPANWGFGYGAYREQEYEGKNLQVAQAPPMNSETIRHIVSAPNHLRAWRESDYWRVGGHNADLHVVDDYELILRTFLHSRLARVPRLCYLQYQSGGRNTTDVRRLEIQRLVRHIARFYDAQIHDRLLELGLEDPAWNDAAGGATFPFEGLPGPRQEQHCTLIAD